MREISTRAPTSKNRWFSPASNMTSPSPSASSLPSSRSVFLGRITPTSSVMPTSCVTSTRARRWPSVATSVRLPGFSTNLAPLRKYRVSSPVIANCVFATISRSAADGNEARPLPLASGSVGKSSRGSVCIRESNRSAATFTPFLSSAIRTSVSGSALTISYSFLAGSVSDPLFATAAWQRLLSATSRSVASIRTSSPLASISTLARIGIVFFRSTMPWKSCSSRRSSVLPTTSSIACGDLSAERLSAVYQDPLLGGVEEIKNYIGKKACYKTVSVRISPCSPIT